MTKKFIHEESSSIISLCGKLIERVRERVSYITIKCVLAHCCLLYWALNDCGGAQLSSLNGFEPLQTVTHMRQFPVRRQKFLLFLQSELLVSFPFGRLSAHLVKVGGRATICSLFWARSAHSFMVTTTMRTSDTFALFCNAVADGAENAPLPFQVRPSRLVSVASERASKMDDCNKVIAILAILYTISNQLKQGPAIQAAAAPSSPDRSPGNRPHELIRRPDWQTNINQQQQQKPQLPADADQFDSNFWRDLQAQLFLAQLLNLTKTRLLDPKAADSFTKLNTCKSFNKSLDTAQTALVKLLELTNLERLHQFELLPRKLALPGAAAKGNLESSLAAQQTSYDKRQQAMRALSDLGNTVALFFQCLSDLLIGKQDGVNQESLIADMIQLGGYMRNLGLHVDRAVSNHDKSFAYLIPELESADFSFDFLSSDASAADKAKQKPGNLMDKLHLAVADLKREMETGAENLKQFLGFDNLYKPEEL